jgi:hypothetical protein
MKIIKLFTLALVLTAFAVTVQAKPIQPAHVYMFGFAGSFKDSVVYITPVEDVKGAWIDSKTKFLLNRDNYSWQLKEHMTEQYQQPDRVCVVFYATSKKKIEKKLKKLRKKYKELTPLPTEFHFEAIEEKPE